MIAFAYYLIKMVICSGLLFAYYHLALRNKIFHQWNRFYLLAAIVISITVPFLQFNWFDSADSADIKVLQAVYSADEYVAKANAGSSKLSLDQWITIFYSLISVSILFVFIRALATIYSIIRTNPVISIDNIKFVNTEEKSAPFSFLNYVVWNKQIDLESTTGKQIFQHELAHVREKHSFDKLFTQIILTVFWCNPFYWLVQRELKMIHEFIADQKSVAQSDVHAFAAMILHAAYPKNYTHLTSPFFHSSIKRRLAMLTKNNNPKFSYWSRILVLPLIAFIVLAFTVKQKAVNSDSQMQGLKTNVSTKTDALEKSKAIIHSGVDKVINSDIKERIINDTVPGNNIVTKQIEGNPLVIIDGKESDKLKELSPGQIESINVLKGESATNKYGTKAKDGVIEITTKNGNVSSGTLQLRERPINEATTTDASTLLRSQNSGLEKPLVIVDGKEVANWEEVPAESIQSLTVFKGRTGIEQYGEKGKNGIIVIQTKNGNAKAQELNITADEVVKTTFGKEERVKIEPTEKINESPDITQIRRDTVPSDNNNVFEKVEKEAEFPGGVKAWFNYLQKNLNANVPVDKGARKGQYTVVVQYIVHSDGSISDVKALTKHGYGMEEEVIRIIKKGPKWIPAIHNGHKVAAYRKQPVTFAVSAG